MLIGYTIALMLFILFFLCTLPYQREMRKNIDKKENKLFLLYGMSMFVADKIPEKILHRNRGIHRAISAMYVKEDIKKEQYLYVVKKLSICFCALFVTLLFGVGISVTENQTQEKINALKRNLTKDTSYLFQAKTEDGMIEEVSINVDRKELSEEEIRKFLLGKRAELKKKVLGENSNANHVNKPLDLISSLGDENIYISWEISDTNIIGYDGSIAQDITDEGKVVSLTAIMTYRKVSVDYTFSVCVYKPEQTGSIESGLQQFVNEHQVGDDKVILPKEIEGKKVIYFTNEKSSTIWIILIGLAVTISLFFLKDKDLKKQVEERNGQMEKDYPEIVSQILLYYGAGISLRATIERMIHSYHMEKKRNPSHFRYVYEELEMSFIKMKSGVSEAMAIEQFGSRCGLQSYKRLAGIIEQNLRRGTNEFFYALKTELNSAMEERKNKALKEGAKISTKLLGPMMIMLVMVMIIIMGPAFMSMSID